MALHLVNFIYLWHYSPFKAASQGPWPTSMGNVDMVAWAISLSKESSCNMEVADIWSWSGRNKQCDCGESASSLGRSAKSVAKRGHKLSHVERWVETRSRNRIGQIKTTNEPTSDSTYDWWWSRWDYCGRSTLGHDVGRQPNRVTIRRRQRW